MNKILKTLLTVVLFFSVGTAINVKAEGNVAKIGDTEYATLADAISAANEGDTIVLIDNVSDISTLYIEKNITIDLNGHTISTAYREVGKHYYAIYNGASLIINDSVGTGKISSRGIDNYGSLTINGGTYETIDSGNGGAAVYNNYLSDGSDELVAELIINDGVFKVTNGQNDSVTQNGAQCIYNQGVAYIYGGTFESNSDSIYSVISVGELTITPSNDKTVSISGVQGGLGINGGNTTINGGSFSSSNHYGLYVSNDGSGTDPEQAIVTVNGGTFSGKNKSVWIGSDVNESVNSTIEINNGTFTQPINAENNTLENAIVVSGGSFVEDVSKYLVEGNEVVKVGDKYKVVTDGTTEVETEQNTLAYDEQVVNHIKETATTTLDEIVSVEPIVLTEGDDYKGQDYAEAWNATEYKTALEEALKDVSNIDEVIPYGIALHVTDKNGKDDLIEELDTKLDFILFLNDTSLNKVKDKKFTLYNIYFNHETDEFEVTPVTSEKTTVTGNSISFKTDRFTVYALVTFKEVTPTATPESKKSTTKTTGGWDDGGPFTTDTCGNVFDRWGNKIYEAKGCNVGGYNLVRTSVED